jgi:glucose-fructose oxidoreductase
MDGGMTRRSFVGGALAAATVPAWGVGRKSQPDERKVGWAILGLGGYATRQIMPAFANCKRSKLVALISGTPSKLPQFGEQYGIPESHRYLYADMAKIRENPDIDVVYVITPPGTHREFSVRAAEAGKHVCCEKPMAPTVEDCQAIIDACAKAGKKLQIGYRSHFQNHNQRAIELCRGELGTLRSITSDHGFNMPDGTWRTQRALSGGGSMMDIGIYSVQALCYLAGEEPTEVVAAISSLPEDRFKEVEDTVHFRLAFPSGVLATGTSGYSWASGANRFQVLGSRSSLHAEPATAYQGQSLRVRNRPVEIEANDQFAAQMDHLSECILENKPVLTPGEMGRRDIAIIQAIYESTEKGGPVRLKP